MKHFAELAGVFLAVKSGVKVIGKKHISLVGTSVFSTSSHQFWMEI
jgi:hypothetical protein